MLRKLVLGTIALGLSIGMAGLVNAADTSTVSGFLRDSFCYTTMGAHGSSHHTCAMKCAKAGIPVMLVQDKTDKGYVLLPPKDDSALPDSVVDKMEDHVTITGNEFTKNGINYLQVQSVK